MFSMVASGAMRAVMLAVVMLTSCVTLSEALAADGVNKSALSQDERASVIAAAQHAQSATRRSLRAVDAQKELLLVERRPGDKGAPRRANVYLYDYARNELEHQVIDVATGEVLHSGLLANVQLPLTQAEIDRATNIVFADADARAQLDQEFSRVTGKPLEDAQQIHFKAFTFIVEPGRRDTLAPGLAVCGATRCAQILMYTADRVVLDVSPVIDLSGQTVLSVMSQGAGLDGERR